MADLSIYSNRPMPSEVAAAPYSRNLLDNQSQVQSDFQQLLLGMLTQQNMPGLMSSGLNFGTLLLPVMFELLEHLGALEPAQVATQYQPSPSSPVPKGMPIVGRLTQDSHSDHVALDFGAPVGTPVKATMDGRVVHAGWNNQGYGNLVIVENGSYRTYYAHLSEIPVSEGQQVLAGTVVGQSGNTGNSTGPHLHYEVRFNNKPIDPTSFTL